MSNSEAILQQTLVSMIRKFYPGVLISLSMSGVSLNGTAKQNAQTMQELKKQGFIAGLPDMIIYLPDGQLLNLELKRPIGGTQSNDQKNVEQKLKSLGHNYHLIRTTVEAFDLIAKYTTVQFRESQLALLGIPETPVLKEQFIHWPKGVTTAAIKHDLAVLYRI